MEYSSSRVCRCGGTSAPTGNGCSTIASAPPVSRPQSLNTTPIVPRSSCGPPPGCTTVRGGAWVLLMSESPPNFDVHYCSANSVTPGQAGQALSEHKCSTDSRPYRMRRRAEQVDQTRQRIVEATVELHGSVGAAAT